MAFGDKGFYEKWKDKRLWRKITTGQITKDLRRLDIEIQREQDKLRQLGKKEDRLKQRAKGKSQIEKRGIVKEIKMLRRESKSHEALLMNLFNQRTTFKQIELYKNMERKAQTKGLQKAFKENQDRLIDIITDKGIDITDDMEIWKLIATETDVVFDTILQSDEEEDDIMAELEEAEMDDDLDDLNLDDDDTEDDEDIVSLRKKRRKKN